MDMERALGQRIKRLRMRGGLSQQTLADKAGLSRIYIAKLEAGERVSPSFPALERIARALGATLHVTLAVKATRGKRRA